MSNKTKLTISHYRNKCIGCGSCALVCPQNWEISEEDGLATLIGSQKKGNAYVGEVDLDDAEDNKKASDICPVGIIRLSE